LIDWAKVRAGRPSKRMVEIDRNYERDLAEIKDKALFNDLKILTDNQTTGVKVEPREPKVTDVADWADFYLKKL